MEEAYRAALACLEGMNCIALPRLIAMAGGAQELWGILREGGKRAAALVGAEKAARWQADCGAIEPVDMLEELGRRGIKVISPADPRFGDRLRSIYDPPAVLFLNGGDPPPDAAYVAVVGARRASSYGRWAAAYIAERLAQRGAVVVSGAAHGIDGCAHRGCLKAGGFTIAVLGCGIDRVYPPEHADLLARISSSGCVISEYPPGEAPLPWRFPHRNRIIAGISHAVVVVEATEKSGALITADMALEEGREVMAVPGPIGSSLSRGTNRLIQKGAKLVMDVDDIWEELPLACSGAALRGEQEAAEGVDEGTAPDKLQRACIELLTGGPRSLDWLAAEIGLQAGELLACLTAMSMRGWVGEEAGGRFRLLIDPACRGD